MFPRITGKGLKKRAAKAEVGVFKRSSQMWQKIKCWLGRHDYIPQPNDGCSNKCRWFYATIGNVMIATFAGKFVFIVER